MAGARSDKLFQKRQARNSFARPNTGTKSPHERILIVCEDSVIAPTYFRKLRDAYGLNKESVAVYDKKHKSLPSAVLECAIQELERDGDYDRAYCVFDKDTHESYAKTLDAIKSNKEFDIITINSVPCFEFWVLLHFELTDSVFNNCTEVGKRIKKHWQSYSKEKTKDIYPHLKDKTVIAIENAKAVIKNGHGDNPSTQIHILVEYLLQQSRK